jgi:hypothetical protein
MFDVLNDIAMQTFAEPFTVKQSSGDVLLQGVFADQVSQESPGGVGFGDRLYTLQLLKATVDSYSIALRDNIEVRGIGYQVIDLQADTSGMATLTMRRY